MGLGIPLVVIILGMAVLVGLGVDFMVRRSVRGRDL
jgi:hypothetical protein